MTDSRRTESGPVFLQPVRDDDATPVDTPSAVIVLARRAADAANEAKKGVDSCRDDMREYTKRDLDEHKEIRQAVKDVDGKIHTLNGHVSDVRVRLEGVSVQLGTFISSVQKAEQKVETQVAIETTDKLSKTDMRRKLVPAAVGVVAAIIGFLTHFLFR